MKLLLLLLLLLLLVLVLQVLLVLYLEERGEMENEFVVSDTRDRIAIAARDLLLNFIVCSFLLECGYW